MNFSILYILDQCYSVGNGSTWFDHNQPHIKYLPNKEHYILKSIASNVINSISTRIVLKESFLSKTKAYMPNKKFKQNS